jgi:hypothetical protein
MTHNSTYGEVTVGQTRVGVAIAEPLRLHANAVAQGEPISTSGVAHIVDVIEKELLMTDHDTIKRDRQAIYGDPLENHKGIGMAWTPLLQPHAEAIARGEPLKPSTVAHLMAAMKLNRMRRVFHADNYDDMLIYLEFARKWQEDGQ